jgi:penicillin-binding protein 1A
MPKVLTNRRVQVVSGVLLVLVFVGVGGSMGFASVVRSSSAETNSFLRSSMSSKLLASDGSLIANLHGEINREPVPLQGIPRSLRNAVIAIEDRRFYSHGAIDLRGTLRAVVRNLRGDREGGSTISQQLAKNLYYHGQPRTVTRKASEAVLAMGLERVSTKDQILQAYLNTAYFGRGAYGVQTAALSYFRKDVSKLDLAESAYLAGLVHMPARYDFVPGDTSADQQQRRRAAIVRRNVVLDAMADVGYISPREAARARSEKLDIKPPKDPRWKHPYFVDAVLRELGVLQNKDEPDPNPAFDFLGTTHTERAQAVYRKGLRIQTTLEPDAQDNAEDAIKAQLPNGVLPKASAALVSVEPGTGFVRALIGGRDYYPKGCTDESTERKCRTAKVNLALGRMAGGSGRHAGSSYKPIVLAAALEEGLSLRQSLNGSPFQYRYSDDPGAEVWKVENYEGSAGGTMSVVDATARSVNAAYARLEVQFLGEGDAVEGSKKVADVSRKLGIGFPTPAEVKKTCGKEYLKTGRCTPADYIPAIALGAKEVAPLEMAGAFATFANEGKYAKPTFIRRITDSSGKVIYDADPKPRQVIKRETALGVTHALQQVVTRGTGRAAGLTDRPVAGKTGTSQMWRDAWFDGYVPQLATAVWIGNPMSTLESMTPQNGYGIRVTGGSYPARIWNAFMGPTLADLKTKSFPDAPTKLFGPSITLKKMKGEVEEKSDAGPNLSDLRSIIRLERSGRNVVVHRECPPGGGGRGMRVWKTEDRGGTTHVYRSRAVC